MDRRKFLTGLAAVIGGIALNEAVPLGRVWSFPKEIKIAQSLPVSIRFVRAWDIERSALTNRLDVLYGIPEIPPEMFFDAEGHRLIGSGEIGQAVGFQWDEETNLASHTVSTHR